MAWICTSPQTPRWDPSAQSSTLHPEDGLREEGSRPQLGGQGLCKASVRPRRGCSWPPEAHLQLENLPASCAENIRSSVSWCLKNVASAKTRTLIAGGTSGMALESPPTLPRPAHTEVRRGQGGCNHRAFPPEAARTPGGGRKPARHRDEPWKREPGKQEEL